MPDRLRDLSVDEQIDLADLRLDAEQLRQLEAIRRMIAIGVHDIMADLSGINDALSDLSAQITQLADQVAGLTAGQVTQEQLDTIEQGIRDAAASVDAIVEPDEGEEPVPGDGGQVPEGGGEEPPA